MASGLLTRWLSARPRADGLARHPQSAFEPASPTGWPQAGWHFLELIGATRSTGCIIIVLTVTL